MASATDTVIAVAIRFLNTDTAFGPHDPRAQAVVEAATCNEHTVDIILPVLVVLEGGRRRALALCLDGRENASRQCPWGGALRRVRLCRLWQDLLAAAGYQELPGDTALREHYRCGAEEES